MCGRYSLNQSASDIETAFGTRVDPGWELPRYNIAPSQDVVAITNGAKRRAELLRWGLIPYGTTNPKGGRKPINARAESVAEAQPFRFAFRNHRCLIVADGFYEWRKSGGARTPYRVGLKGWRPFTFAGLSERWRSPDSEMVRSCCIITTVANALMEPIHDRMPVILTSEAARIWLDPDAPAADLRELLVPYAAGEMETYEVSPSVNSWENDDPGVIEPVARLPM